MTSTLHSFAKSDAVWDLICEEAKHVVESEPLLGGVVHSSVLHHDTLENALAYRISLKLASAEMSEQILRELERCASPKRNHDIHITFICKVRRRLGLDL